MNPYLAAAELAIVLGALVGTIYLRRLGDRKWAEHLARQRIVASPDFQRIAANFAQMQVAFREALTPALQRMAAAMAELAPKIEEIYKQQPWWRRLAWRVRARWFA